LSHWRTKPDFRVDMTSVQVQSEIDALCAQSTNIIASVAKVHPSGSLPRLGHFDGTYFDPLYGTNSIRFEASFPLIFDDGTEWVINFPLFCMTGYALPQRKVQFEVSTLKWVKSHTTLPVPAVHAYDSSGTASWNALCRPCVILDRMPGKKITANDWKAMTNDQQLLIVDQLARIKAELTAQTFDRIGSVFFDDSHYSVRRLVSHTINRYCSIYAYNRKLVNIFNAPKSPYTTAMEFLVDMANLRLIYEARGSLEMSDAWVEMWIYRSMIPSLVPDEFNRGPFVLGHGNLDRAAVLFDDDFRLSGIINWGFSVTEPFQMASFLPPFFVGLPMENEAGVNLTGEIVACYAVTLRKYERELCQKSQNYDRPLLADLMGTPKILRNVGYFLTGSDILQNTAGIWENIIQPSFGGIDRASLLNLYRHAPGLLDEFMRTRLLLETSGVGSYPDISLMFLAIIGSGISKG
jgi:hypothetical protein